MIEVRTCIENFSGDKACIGDYIKPMLSMSTGIKLENKFYQLSDICDDSIVLNGGIVIPLSDIRSFHM